MGAKTIYSSVFIFDVPIFSSFKNCDRSHERVLGLLVIYVCKENWIFLTGQMRSCCEFLVVREWSKFPAALEWGLMGFRFLYGSRPIHQIIPSLWLTAVINGCNSSFGVYADGFCIEIRSVRSIWFARTMVGRWGATAENDERVSINRH